MIYNEWKIEKTDNGFIVSEGWMTGRKLVFKTFDELITYLKENLT